MAHQTLTSSNVTFLDYTDNRKLEAYITSNLPNTQIYNPNNGAYSPNWSSTHLELNADIYLDVDKLTEGFSITWYEQLGTNTKTKCGENVTSITINTNKMVNSTTSVIYSCVVQYQNLTTQAQIFFMRSDSGLNGADGTSVNIQGVAYHNGTLTDENIGQVVELYVDKDFTIAFDPTSLNTGDSYIAQGYLCMFDADSDAFICTGKIQGPQGESAKNVILNADAQVFRVDKTNTVTPSKITITAQMVNTIIPESGWSYSIDGGTTFDTTIPAGIVKKTNQVIVTGAEITSDAIIIKVSDGTYSDTYSIYKVYDGDIGDSAPISFLTNENITFSADAQGQIAGISVTTNVVAYSGVRKILPTIGEINNVPEGMVINTDNISVRNNELVLTIEINHNATLGSILSNSGTVNIPIISPIDTNLTLSWSKINTGATGASGADAITFQVYSADGYILSKETPSVLLQTFAYNGDIPISGGATYQWYERAQTIQYGLAVVGDYDESDSYYIVNSSGNYEEISIENEDVYNTYFGDGANAGTPLYIQIDWVKLTEEKEEEIINETTGESTFVKVTALATSPYITIHHTGVSFSNSYMCKMTFNGIDYVDVVTIDDKNDTNAIFTSKPTSYSAGDIWVVGNDYVPEGVEVGTVLKAQYTNKTYSDSDWVIGTKYDDRLDNLETTIGTYQQYMSVDTTYGIKMNAVDENGNVSEFSTTLSHTQLSFNQGEEAVAYINNHKMHITEAEVESPLTVTGKYSGSTMLQAPTINLGNFSFVIESNGSLSIVSNL